MLFEYPTKEDWNRISKSFPVKKLNVDLSDFKLEGNSSDHFSRTLEIWAWVNHLQNRIYDVWKSYVLLAYYFEKGIPDDEWFISPGKQGESVQYFPHFEKKHFLIKSEFDYYVDVFYYKIFSALDTIGHLLNVLFKLKIKRANFKLAIAKLESANINLSKKLRSIIDDPAFRKAKKLRDDFTHNYLPSTVDSGIDRPSEHKVTFGVGKYTKSSEFYGNVCSSLHLFVKTLECIKQQS